MGFINMVGLPYCNASRVTEEIYFYSEFDANEETSAEESQATSRYFRLGCHSLLATLASLFCFISMMDNG